MLWVKFDSLGEDENLEEKHEREHTDVQRGGLDAMLVIRSAQTDGVFTQVRGLQNQVKLTRKLSPLWVHSQLCCQSLEGCSKSKRLERKGEIRYVFNLLCLICNVHTFSLT